MKMKNQAFLSVLFAAGAAVALTSCSKNDLFDSSSLENSQKENYAANFVNKYGAIDANQTWDFTKGTKLGTRAAETITTQVIDGLDFGVENGKFTKNNSIYDAIKTVLPERVQHEGKPAVLVAPASSFYIFPISTQGRWTHDLKIKVGDQEPVKLYEKRWTDWSKPYVNGMVSQGYTIDMKGLYVEAPVGTPIEVFIDNVLDNGRPRATVGTSNGQAIYVDVPEDVVLELNEGIELNEGAVIKYIGIEDITPQETAEKTDNDFNDVVLAVVGNPDVPQEVIITNESYQVETNLSKRYMIEDLGAIDDFDFNDVVVDVIQNNVITHKVTYENNVLKTDEITGTESSQKAIIRAMGGTLDFTLKIGDTTWKKSGDENFNVGAMYNTQGTVNYDAELVSFPVTGWVPEENNLSVEVLQSSGAVFNVTFPKKGTAPMIIAVDPTTEWMNERVSVPATWFYTE